MTVASLGMYDHPAQHDANDALWAAVARSLRAHGVDAPLALDRSRPVEDIWRDPDLLLAQACGLPLVNDPGLRLRVVAVPSYAVAGCAAGRHYSHLIVRDGDAGRSLVAFTGRRAAVNSFGSNTGHALFQAAMGRSTGNPEPFASVIETGSHRASVVAVRKGAADIAAIDAVTWAALDRFEPDTTVGLRILASTPSSPALPFVTAAATDNATMARLPAALARAIADPALENARGALFLTAITPATARRYAILRRNAGIEEPR